VRVKPYSSPLTLALSLQGREKAVGILLSFENIQLGVTYLSERPQPVSGDVLIDSLMET